MDMTIGQKIDHVRTMLYDLWSLQGEKDTIYLPNEKLPSEIDKTVDLPDILIKFKNDGLVEDFEEGYGAMKPGGEIAVFGHIEKRPSYTIEIEEGGKKRRIKRLADTSMWKIKLNPQKLIASLDKRIVLQVGKRKQIVPPALPPGTRWEDITIKFLDGQEVLIKARNFSQHTDYAAMGFQDERKKMPNTLWAFLVLLSQNNGEISWRNPRATDKGKKNKQLLSDSLQAYFRIEDEPFYEYKEEKAYKLKMKLEPESGSDTGIHDYPEDAEDM